MATVSVLSLITDALQDAGVLAADETPSASDGQKAFRLLNRMLDTASTEVGMIYNNVQEVFDLTSGQLTYTLGPGGDFNTTRPIDINEAYMRDVNNNDLKISILQYQEYADIISKTTESGIALALYYNAGYPLSEITMWPVVTGGSYRLVLWSWKLLTQFTELSDNVILPPGYEEYIETNLAVRCCIAFNRQVPPELAIWATESKAQLKRINVNVPLMSFPSGLSAGQDSNTFPISPSILTGY